jgi:hypothetical protein
MTVGRWQLRCNTRTVFHPTGRNTVAIRARGFGLWKLRLVQPETGNKALEFQARNVVGRLSGKPYM